MAKKTRAKPQMKCILWFTDGNIRTFYAPPPGRKDPDQEYDRLFQRMYRLIIIRWRSAGIYETEGKELAAYYKGKRIR